MKVTLLTTETIHHNFFIREILKLNCELSVFVESKQIPKIHFETYHPFEDDRDKYELNRWFSGLTIPISEICPVNYIEDVNSNDSISLIMDSNPDLIIVFGTGFIKKKLIELYPEKLINLHGGNPTKYRGLDSHLWTIYHKDFKNLTTTLHKVDQGLDTGEIIMQSKIPLSKGDSLVTIRAKNTEVCVRLCECAIDMFKRNKKLLSVPQLERGRYYSAMPDVLKKTCKENLDNYLS